MTTTSYSIDGFWSKRIPEQPTKANSSRKRWYSDLQGLATFKETRLMTSDKFGECLDADTSSLILVSAPGAVGKSTLARQIAYKTGATYIDLAEAEPVGGDTFRVRRSIVNSRGEDKRGGDTCDEDRCGEDKQGADKQGGETLPKLSRDRGQPCA